MDLIFEATKGFEEDIDKLDKRDRERVVEKIGL
jgi:hypothetical protein